MDNFNETLGFEKYKWSKIGYIKCDDNLDDHDWVNDVPGELNDSWKCAKCELGAEASFNSRLLFFREIMVNCNERIMVMACE